MPAVMWRCHSAASSVGSDGYIPMVLMIGCRVGIRCMVSPRPKPTRSWRCSMSGLTSTGLIANSHIGGRGWAGSGRRPQRSQTRNGWAGSGRRPQRERVLERHHLRFRAPKHEGRSTRRPWPDWVEEAPNRIWIYDTTHWTRAGAATTVISDVITRKWIAHITSADETSIEVQAVFNRALKLEGIDEIIDEVNPNSVQFDPDNANGDLPVLLVMSDNGPQMTSGSTREFMALCWLATHYGRPGTPTDQAWIESLFGHLKNEHPHLEQIQDIDVLRAELNIRQRHYNEIRLHAGIGYVTPNEQHNGHGDTVRQQRRDGLTRARQNRIVYNRNNQP